MKKLREMDKEELKRRMETAPKIEGSGGATFAMILYMAAGAFCGLSFGLNTDGLSFLSLLVFLLTCAAAMLLHIIIHEAGHLVFGLLSGYGFGSYRIGPVMLKKENGSIVLRRFSVPGTGGQCLMSPPEPYSEDMPVLLYNLGGSLGNLITAAIALTLAILLPVSGMLASALQAFAAFGLVICLINAIPLRIGFVNNDGRNALELCRDPSSKRGFWIQLNVVNQLSMGVRLKDMPDEWFILPETDKLKGSLWAAVAVIACGRAMDAHDFAMAEQLGGELLDTADGLLGIQRNNLINDIMFCQLIGSGIEEKTVKRVKRANQITEFSWSGSKKSLKKASFNNISIQRTLYAVNLLAQDEQAAEKALIQFEKLAKRHPYPSEVEGERELLELVRRKYISLKEAQDTSEPSGDSGEAEKDPEAAAESAGSAEPESAAVENAEAVAENEAEATPEE